MKGATKRKRKVQVQEVMSQTGVRERTVLRDDDLAHLLQPCDEELVSDNQHVADKLYIQRLWQGKVREQYDQCGVFPHIHLNLEST